MQKAELIQLLKDNHQEFIDQLRLLSDADFCFAPEGKWSAAQQLDHIIKSISPVSMAMSLPSGLLQLLFGKANRPSRSYAALVEKYTLKLNEGGRASGRFIPGNHNADNRDALVAKLNRLTQKLCEKVNHYSEASLDRILLPHPLLGKLTLREMIYFTAYHVKHHGKLVAKGLSKP